MASLGGSIKQFPNRYTLCNNDINKFILLLRKGFYPYEYMGSWERFDETMPPYKKYITDEDSIQVQTAFQ